MDDMCLCLSYITHTYSSEKVFNICDDTNISQWERFNIWTIPIYTICLCVHKEAGESVQYMCDTNISLQEKGSSVCTICLWYYVFVFVYTNISLTRVYMDDTNISLTHNEAGVRFNICVWYQCVYYLFVFVLCGLFVGVCVVCTICLCFSCVYYLFVFVLCVLFVCVFLVCTICLCLSCVYYLFVFVLCVLFVCVCSGLFCAYYPLRIT